MKSKTIRITLTATFLAMGIALPFIFGQIPQIGSMLLPMHIPVFLCAFICGWKYGVWVAVVLPLLRSVAFGRPNMYPEAIAIAFEMATYALVAGFLYSRFQNRRAGSIYACLLSAMLLGRVVRGLAQFFLLGINGVAFTFELFFTGIVLVGIPGILLQLIAIPAIMLTLDKLRIIPFA